MDSTGLNATAAGGDDSAAASVADEDENDGFYSVVQPCIHTAVLFSFEFAEGPSNRERRRKKS